MVLFHSMGSFRFRWLACTSLRFGRSGDESGRATGYGGRKAVKATVRPDAQIASAGDRCRGSFRSPDLYYRHDRAHGGFPRPGSTSAPVTMPVCAARPVPDQSEMTPHATRPTMHLVTSALIVD